MKKREEEDCGIYLRKVLKDMRPNHVYMRGDRPRRAGAAKFGGKNMVSILRNSK